MTQGLVVKKKKYLALCNFNKIQYMLVCIEGACYQVSGLDSVF